MGKRSLALLFGVLFIFTLLCFLTYGEELPLTAEEKGWLEKASRLDVNGWIFLHLEGTPFEMGFQRGYLTADEIHDFFQTVAHTQKFETAKEIDFFVQAASEVFKDKIPSEHMEEIKGLVSGMEKAGKRVTLEEMLFMNGFIDILWHWWPFQQESEKVPGPGCSAFMATGDATTDGQIVMAHNSWYFYALLRFCNIIVDMIPEKGHRILMQSWGPCLYSATDFFITDAGLMGTETTIGGFQGFDPQGIPVFVRARKAMQYADSIDQWAKIMIRENNGAYANSWLLGDIRSKEIARLELGLKHHSLEKKKNGYFHGSNVAENIKILREETTATYDDVRDFCVARRVRWKQLMKKHYGKINVESAKQMLADHYDVYLEEEKPSFRTICGHWELDDGMIPGTLGAYLPGGAVDGKVVDSTMAKNWKLWAKWGSSCDIGFNAQEFLKKHPQYEWLEGYLKDLPAMPWTVFPPQK